MAKTRLLREVSENFGLTEREVLVESINTFLDREMRKSFSEIEKFKEKYNVETPRNLKKKIERGEVEEHPTWEELIEWENLTKRIKVVKKWKRI